MSAVAQPDEMLVLAMPTARLMPARRRHFARHRRRRPCRRFARRRRHVNATPISADTSRALVTGSAATVCRDATFIDHVITPCPPCQYAFAVCRATICRRRRCPYRHAVADG